MKKFNNVADPDAGSGALLTPESELSNYFLGKNTSILFVD
jgi:hypothetical protein